ncbi:indolepyruvate ferredoxin oxidoreductase family protein [Mycobacterium sp. KBS0706]|uniref:indolepyruvate ferredoxin oxidoreductase family protein n=1 Tax=Mycobacterium sp. KBS0706 TaxID=2578109 RepID=UPI00110FDF0D|nr:indolepyruvate ferredoxin oxidoreductase family protein [Mycobacterium sp. KBS0706]TSD89173.1 indolepyruvate ferredoxin oxidoreductase family protein [Mycobacterium sp. KBS0706]
MTATALASVSLEDKYTLDSGRIYLTGIQALVRLPLMQRRRDEAAGLNTACFISGYRGSPLGGYDQALWAARKFLQKQNIEFQPGLNEDLGATAVWGSQQVGLWPGAKHDGVFGIWYGKGPGVDRTGDVLKHANFAGTSKFGGVLALAGDDHACKSSTVPHQSEHAFIAHMMPVLNPTNVQEILDYGLYGWAMSRYSGLWVGFKTIAENVDSSASVHVDPDRVQIVLPEDFAMPPGGLNIRWPDPPLVQEERLMRDKLYAALAFARANRLDHLVYDSGRHRFGIVTTGKSYLDVRQALDDLGIDRALAAELGICIYKVGMPWPLEPTGVRAFAEGLDELIVVEEKRALIENQLKEQLYNWHADKRPVIVGKFDEKRDWILPSTGELTPAQIAVAIGKRLLKYLDHPGLAERVRYLEEREGQKKIVKAAVDRVPFFCSGCPHNTSTRVPEGSRAMAGIGCHYMATWMPDRKAETFSQMGGEGAAWIGQAPFTDTKHVFVNLGDGTYFHSGSLAIRAALAAGVNATYKILFNDAVAMTGGQPVDGTLTVPMIAAQLRAEGVQTLVVVTDRPEIYGERGTQSKLLPAGVPVEHRDELDHVQRRLRETPGVSVMIYDQTCAAEKRRRRKRGLMEDPARRVVINEAVCEGCGDCSKVSNCLSVVPVETEFGRKRAIDQSSCNKDYSCVNGFCPSFVSVLGGKLRKPKPAAEGQADLFPVLPEPELPSLDQPYGIMITGIGGTGVITIGALLGMASHLEGKGVSVLDQAGLAQKGGAVVSHVRIARTPEEIHAVRIAAGGARLMLGCDLVVAASGEAQSKIHPGLTRQVVNSHETITGAFTRNPDFVVPGASMLEAVAKNGGDPKLLDSVDATRLATALLGDSIATNLFMLGYAWQKGLVPVSHEALEKAIELNGTAVAMNKAAFLWGRRAAHDLAAVERLATPPQEEGHRLSRTLDEVIARRVEQLTAYQDAAYAVRFSALVGKVRAAEAKLGREELTEAVARNYYKLLAYKDEYEVARLYTDGSFLKQIEAQFEGGYTLQFHLAPPSFSEKDPETGHLKKRSFGPWMLRAFGLLARMKRLRGTALDPFGRTAERKGERQLIADYEAVVEELLARLGPDTHAICVAIARVPEQIRGYGHIKDENRDKAKAREAALLATLRTPAAPKLAAE